MPKKLKTPSAKTRKPKSRRTRAPRKPRGPRKPVPVNVLNWPGAETVPQYTGPNRGAFVFNPVFPPIQAYSAQTPPMNSGPSIASAPVRRPVEISTQTEPEGIFEEFVARSSSSVGDLSGIHTVPEEPEDNMVESMTVKDLRKVLKGRGYTSRELKAMRKPDLLEALKGP